MILLIYSKVSYSVIQHFVNTAVRYNWKIVLKVFIPPEQHVFLYYHCSVVIRLVFRFFCLNLSV